MFITEKELEEMGRDFSSQGYNPNHPTILKILAHNKKCEFCNGGGLVCENHRDKEWTAGLGGCECGAGMPCDCMMPGSGLLKLVYKKIIGINIETGFCDDCQKPVKLDIYNHKTSPKLMLCAECGQFAKPF